jgi:steroid delta-isomerase-like uncharacterized protein
MDHSGFNKVAGVGGNPMSANEVIRQIAKDFFEQIWNQGDESAIDRFISENTVGNDPQFGTGRESFRAKWREWQSAFPDIHFRVDDVIVEGNQVVTKWHLTGTQTGELEGMPPSNKKVAVDGVSIDQIENGMVVSGFDAWDSLNFRKQLGLPL